MSRPALYGLAAGALSGAVAGWTAAAIWATLLLADAILTAPDPYGRDLEETNR